jgi:uncharacterized membrane protein YidH (DUF202 family)
MDAPTEMRQRAALSDYLAAERTLLAWIRTGLALMGFGFVVTPSGLFLQQLQALEMVCKHLNDQRFFRALCPTQIQAMMMGERSFRALAHKGENQHS